MKNKISLSAAVLLAGTALLADSATIADALKNGTFEGELALYGTYSDIKNAQNFGFASGSFNMAYATDKFHGFSASVGSRANHGFVEVEKGDYYQDDKAILHTANIAYSHEYFDVIFGRQEINLNWMSDFHEALVGVLKFIPNTTIAVGYSQRVAVADYDDPLVPFTDLGKDGAFVADAKWSGLDGLVVNPYLYYAHDIAYWGGASVSYDRSFEYVNVGGTIQYAMSHEDVGEDGSFFQIEGRVSHLAINAKVGYFQSDDKGGIGSMSAAGENINPFEDGDQVYDIDAKTFYIGADYTFMDFTVAALFGHTRLGELGSHKMNEFDLGVNYQVDEHISLGAIVVVADTDSPKYNDYKKAALTAVYAF